MASSDLSGLSVLVAEDNNYSRELVSRLARELGATQVHDAANGAEALSLLSAEARDVDLVISDFNMPVVHGLQLLKAVRTAQRYFSRALPFAMLTSYSDKNLIDLAVALDVNAFLIKPVSKNGLGSRLAKMLAQAEQERWLKASGAYLRVNVEMALYGIDESVEMGTDHGADEAPEMGRKGRPRARRVFVGSADMPLFRDAEPEAGEKPTREPAGDAPSKEASAVSGQRLCLPDEIPKNAILARNVRTADGRLLMSAGQTISPRATSMLKDFKDLDMLVDDIWIVA